jgi:lipid A 4'-phosphatase
VFGGGLGSAAKATGDRGMPTTSAAGADSPRQKAIWRWCVGAFLLAGAVCFAVPDIDLWVSRAVHAGPAGFIGHHHAWVTWLRNALIVFYFSCLAVSLAGWVWAFRAKRTVFGVDLRQWSFLVLCLSLGPGLVANLVFKDQWGRARPKNVIEFGGDKRFTAPLLRTDQCRRGCSFVSGEASSVFVPFYAAAAVVPQWAATLVIAGTIGGFITGGVRISQGAHFLSDIVFAGLFMALLVLLLSRLLRSRGPLRTDEPAVQPAA